MANKPKAIVLTEAQMGFVDNAVKAITGWLSTETKTAEDVKTLKANAKKAIEAHKVELNLNLKALKMSGFKLFQFRPIRCIQTKLLPQLRVINFQY